MLKCIKWQTPKVLPIKKVRYKMMPTTIDGEIYYNTNEACKAIGVSRETLNRYVNQGLIRRYKQGITRTAYYKERDIEELVRRRAEIREEDLSNRVSALECSSRFK
jgi:hypothetical protein